MTVNGMDLLVNGGLFGIFLVVLILPFKVKQVEHNLEVFLFACGVVALTIAGFMTIPGETTGSDSKDAARQSESRGIAPHAGQASTSCRSRSAAVATDRPPNSSAGRGQRPPRLHFLLAHGVHGALQQWA